MAVDPLIFDIYYPKEFYEWKHTIGTLFITCHIEEHLVVHLAFMKLAGQAPSLWFQQRGTSAYVSWDGMYMALQHKYDAEALEQEKNMDLHQARSINLRKSPEENMNGYALRFKEEIMEVQLREISDKH